MRFLVFPILFATIILYISSCANQGAPTGGPRDTIPPGLVNTFPVNKTLNYKDNEFTLTFDEYINADQLKSKLVITPRFDNKFNHRIKKNTIIIRFESSFEDSTTYTLNFADGITDVTEKNPAVNLSLAFSTGPTIDSMYISGTVRDLYTNANQKEILIALFDQEDTLDIFSGKPKYFTKTDPSGFYRIENIKNGLYKLYAFDDQNSNLQNEPKEESHGFKAEFIDLNQPKDSIDLLIQLIDSSPLRLIRSKTTGKYFDVQYNKYIESYDITVLDNTKESLIPANNLINDNETLRFYPDIPELIDSDSLGISIEVMDSLNNQLTDTVYVLFKESTRKPEKFSFSLKPANRTDIHKNFQLHLSFDKPIAQVTYDSLVLAYDTVRYETLSDTLFTWNNNKTALTIDLNPDPRFLPNTYTQLKAQFSIDSTEAVNSLPDSLHYTILDNQPNPYTNQVIIKLGQGAFISVDVDSTDSKTHSYLFPDPSEYGIVSGTIETTRNSYTLQLIDTEFNIIDQRYNSRDFQFKNVKPGKYTFRVLIDDNEDGQWSNGNILQNEEPESIWFYEQTFDLRANWQVENLELSF